MGNLRLSAQPVLGPEADGQMRLCKPPAHGQVCARNWSQSILIGPLLILGAQCRTRLQVQQMYRSGAPRRPQRGRCLNGTKRGRQIQRERESERERERESEREREREGGGGGGGGGSGGGGRGLGAARCKG